MKPNIFLILTAALVFGISGFAFATANQDAPIRTAAEKWGYGVGFTMLGLLSSTAFVAYLAGRHDGERD